MLVLAALVLVVPAWLAAVEPTAPPAGWAEFFGDQPFDARQVLRWPYRVIAITERVWVPLDLVLGTGGSMLVVAALVVAIWPRLVPRSVGMEVMLVMAGLAGCAVVVSWALVVPGMKIVGTFMVFTAMGIAYGGAELVAWGGRMWRR